MLVRYAILSLLQREELHGYKLKSIFTDAVGAGWALNFGQIYQCLKQLKARGLVEARFDAGGRHIGRWVYKITPKGRRALATWARRAPRTPDAPREEIFIRLLAVADASYDECTSHLANERRVHEKHLEQLRARREMLEPLNGSALIQSLVLDAAVLRSEAHLLWIHRCEQVLAAREGRAAPAIGNEAHPVGLDADSFESDSLHAAN